MISNNQFRIGKMFDIHLLVCKKKKSNCPFRLSEDLPERDSVVWGSVEDLAMSLDLICSEACSGWTS